MSEQKLNPVRWQVAIFDCFLITWPSLLEYFFCQSSNVFGIESNISKIIKTFDGICDLYAPSPALKVFNVKQKLLAGSKQ